MRELSRKNEFIFSLAIGLIALIYAVIKLRAQDKFFGLPPIAWLIFPVVVASGIYFAILALLMALAKKPESSPEMEDPYDAINRWENSDLRALAGDYELETPSPYAEPKVRTWIQDIRKDGELMHLVLPPPGTIACHIVTPYQILQHKCDNVNMYVTKIFAVKEGLEKYLDMDSEDIDKLAKLNAYGGLKK